MINAKAVKSLVKTRRAVASNTEGSSITAIVQIKRQNSVPNFQDELYQAVQRSDRRALKSMLTRPEVLSFVRQERFQPVTCETHHSQAVTCSPLHYSLDSTRAMEMLLKAGANPNAELTDAVGNFHTPLWYAAYMGRAPAVEVLLKYGANKNKVGWGAGDIYGTPMEVAKQANRKQVVHVFLNLEEQNKGTICNEQLARTMMDQSRMIAILAQQVGILSSEIKSLSSSPGGRLSKEDEGLEVDSLEGYTIEMMPEDASSTTTDEDDSSSSSPRHLEQIPLANMFKKHKFTASPTRQFNRSHSLQQFDDVGSSGDLSESVKPRKKSAGNETNKLLQVPKC